MIRLVATSILAVSISGNVLAEKVNILLNNFTPPSFFMYTELPEWGAQVQDATDGRVTVTTTASTLAPPPEQWNAIENGIFDAAWIFNSFISNRVSLSLVGQLPFVGGSDSRATGVALWNTHQKYFTDAKEYDGVHLLSLFAFSGADLHSLTDTPINSMNELSNRRMWTLPGAATTAARRAGSGIVSSPATQVHDYVSRNVVQGTYGINLSTSEMYNVLDYARSITEFPREVFNATFSLIISEETWDRISPEDQEAIMSISGATFSERIGEVVNAMNDESRGRAIENGVRFIEADPEFYEELQAVLSDAEEEWVARANALGVDGREALAFYKAEVIRLEGE